MSIPSLPAFLNSQRLFRAMCPAELADLKQLGMFRPGPPSYQGKWFAETAAAAEVWGKGVPVPFHVISIELPIHVVQQMYFDPHMDQIGQPGMLMV